MTTELVAPAEIDPDGGLFGRRSVLGGLLIAAALTFFGPGLSALDDAVRKADGFTVGEPVDVADGVQFTPAPGWVNDPDQTQVGLAVVAHKDGWEIKVAAGLMLLPGESIADYAEPFRDDSEGFQVTDLVTFTTTSGNTGVSWETHGSTGASGTWLVAEGADLVQMLASGSATNLDDVEEELQQMAESISIEGSGE